MTPKLACAVVQTSDEVHRFKATFTVANGQDTLFLDPMEVLAVHMPYFTEADDGGLMVWVENASFPCHSWEAVAGALETYLEDYTGLPPSYFDLLWQVSGDPAYANRFGLAHE